LFPRILPLRCGVPQDKGMQINEIDPTESQRRNLNRLMVSRCTQVVPLLAGWRYPGRRASRLVRRQGWWDRSLKVNGGAMTQRRRRSAERVILSDVAKAAGCSLMSASRALSQPGRVSDALREQEVRAAKVLGYVPVSWAWMYRDDWPLPGSTTCRRRPGCIRR